MEIIYVYSTESLQDPRIVKKPTGDVFYKPWFKIGMTTQDCADDRIIQQDRTANPEPLIKLYELDLIKAGHNMTAYTLEQKIHRLLTKAGKHIRKEWFELENGIEEVKALIEKIVDDSDLHKNEIILKPHQIEANSKINECFKTDDKRCLLNHKPRSGKTFTSLFHIKEKQYKNVAILTSYPILNYQWEDTIEESKGFSNYKILNVSGSNLKQVELSNKLNNIVLMSLQDVKGGEEVFEKEKFELIKDIDWDLIIIDEVHYGVETEKTQNFLDKIKFQRLIGLSATPAKNLICGRFSNDQIHTYTLIEEYKLKKQYPELYNYADINFYLWNLSSDEKKILTCYSDEEQLTMKKLFRIENDSFYYKNDIIYIFKKLVGDRSVCLKDNLKTIYPFKNNGKFNQVKTILLFLPSLKAQYKLKDLLKEIDIYNEDFNIHLTNSNEYSSKQLIYSIKREFKSGDKRSLILAVDQLTTGITLEDCDMVCLMNDWCSVDKYIQASFRCQSPRNGKNDCFVVDLNPTRSFEMIYEYNNIISRFNGKSMEQTLIDWFECVNVFNRVDGEFLKIDVDRFNQEYFKSLAEKIRFNYNSVIYSNKLELVRDKLLNIGITHGKNSEKKELNPDGTPKGKNVKIKKEGESDKKEPEISITKLMEIAKALVDKTMLISIFTYFEHDKIDECLDILGNDLSLVPGIGELESKMFLDTLLIGMENIENVKLSDIKFIYNTIFDKDIINDKLYIFNSKIKKIRELIKNGHVEMLTNYIELIDSYLKPSNTEKKVFAEVMTSFTIIDEMLDLFDQDDFKNPYLTWYGPTAGLGNFQVKIVERLMIGLKEWEPDDEKRYKHIIENQIIISELQSKNVFLFIMIFDPDNKYNLRFFRGSFLSKEFDEKMKEWGITKFDRIVENPPFNQMIDMDILQKCYTLSDNIIFVHPSTWLLDEKNKQKKFIKTKELVGDSIKEIILFNGNSIFNIQLFVPCVITHIDKNKVGKEIKCIDKINNIELIYNNYSEINKYSNNDIYPVLKEKILKKSKNDNLFIYLKNCNDDNFYVNISQIRGHVDLKSNIMLKNDFYTIVTKDLKVSQEKRKQREKTQASFKNEIEANNFLDYIKTTFCRFCLSILKNNQNTYCGEMEMIPWLDFTQEWTDDKLFRYFDLTIEEIEFINKNIVKYYDN